VSKLIVGPQQKCVGSVPMRKSTGVFAVVAEQPVANAYPSDAMPGSVRGVPRLSGTDATDVILNHNGQIY
jgi:hypothetical protein